MSSSGKVLVIDDNAVFVRGLVKRLESRGIEVEWKTHSSQVTSEVLERGFEVAMIEAVMSGVSGARLIDQLKNHAPRIKVLVVAASASLETALEVMKNGAVDYLVKPIDTEVVVEKICDLLSDGGTDDSVPEDFHTPELIGESPGMKEVLALVERVASTDAPVLILGDSGTGKELVARAIHHRSNRRSRVFLAVNCGALAEGVLDSELFGHVRGAFTGARSGRRGLFEEASGGTIFLDEIASTPVSFQVKLLRVLEDGEVRPVGSSSSIRTDVRIIAASNVDLKDAVRRGRFRDDLYYRLNVVSLTLPPLKSRGRDVELLTRHFIERAALELHKTPPRLSPELLSLLQRYRWPGNVRELRNVIEHAVLMADGARLSVEHAPPEIVSGDESVSVNTIQPYAQAKRDVLSRFTREYVERLLSETDGNITRAARIAEIPRQTLHRLVRAIRKDADEASH